MTDTTTVDPDVLLAEIMLSTEGKADPYPRYAAIREHSPAFRTNLGFVVVGRFDDCQWVLRDPRFGKGEVEAPWEQYGLTEEEWLERFSNFTQAHELDARHGPARPHPPPPPRREGVHPEDGRAACVRTSSGSPIELLDRLERGTVVDVIPELALQLPIAVISEMLGVPESYWPELQPLVRTATATLELNPTLEQLEAAADAARGVAERFEGLIAERRDAADRGPAVAARPRRGAGRPAQPPRADRERSSCCSAPGSRPRPT